MKHLRLLVIALILLSCFFLFSTKDSQKQDTKAVEFTSISTSLKKPRELSSAWSQSPSGREDILKEAKQHREAFAQLMKEEPEIALVKAISLSEFDTLPSELRPFFEEPFSAIGTTELLWAVSELPDGTRHCSSRNTVTIGDSKLKALSSDGRPLNVLKNVPLTGIRLGDSAIVSSLPSLPLSQADLAAARSLYPLSENGTLDPLTQVAGQSDAAALIGGTLYHFESPDQLAAVSRHLTEAIDTAKKNQQQTISHPFEWLAGSDDGDSAGDITDATPYQEDQIDVLFIRVDFSDFPGEPISKADLEATLATVDGHIANNSYGKAGITFTVSDSFYHMPSTGATYAVNEDNDGIQTDARALAAANYNIAAYDVIAVYFPDLGDVPGSKITYGGLASIGGENHWINGTNSVGVILHEFGHNYGLYHANYYHPEQALGGTYQVEGSLEYGDIFDEMGSGSSPEAHFSHLAKNYLQWMPDSKVTEATSDATFTIYRFDDLNAESNPLLAVKVPMSGDVNYWIGYRQLYTSSSYNLETAAYVVAENLAAARETSLIDMTPESEGSETLDRHDAGLPVGGTFYEPNAGVRFNALARGGTDPNQWIQVQVVFDPRISVAAPEVSVDEQCGIATVTVQRQFSSTGEITVNYATANGSATSGTDYYPTSGTLTWPDGDLADKTITIPIRPDIIAEGSETLTLSLSGVIGGKLDSGASQTTISILDAGQRDEEFAPGFFNTTVNAIVPLDDGKVMIAGNIEGAIGEVAPVFHMARLFPDGSVDTSFSTGIGPNSKVEAMIQQDDGKFVIGGNFTTFSGNAAVGLARVNPDGSIDSSFATAIGAGANGKVTAIAIEASGKILVGGEFTEFDGTPALGLVRLNASGTRDAISPLTLPFNTGFGTEIYAILPEAGGKFVVVGSFYVDWTGSGFRAGLARLNSDGSRDTTFDPDAGAHLAGDTGSLRRVYAVVAAPDDRYLIAGSFTAYDENPANRIARINHNGSFDGTFNPPAFNNTARALLSQPDGFTITAGSFTSPATRIERLDSTGSADPGFNQGSGVGGTVYALVEGPDGSIWVGGNFFNYNGSSSRPVVRIAGGVNPYDNWAQTQFTAAQITSGTSAPDQDPDADGMINFVEMAMGTDPTVPDSAGVFSIAAGGATALVQSGGQDYLQVSLSRSSLPKGAWFAAQFTSDLNSWSPSTPTPGASSTYDIIEDSATRFTVRDKSPSSPTNSRFGRFSVISPE